MSKPLEDEHRSVNTTSSHHQGQTDGGDVEARETGQFYPRMELAKANLLWS